MRSGQAIAPAADQLRPDHPDPVLHVRGLRAGYSRRVAVVHDVSLDVVPGQMVALLGPNGSGKSTLLKSVFGLTQVMNGSVTFGGRDITRLPPYKRYRFGLGYVPQQDAVFAGLTVRENLAVGVPHLSGRAAARRAEQLLDTMPALRSRLGTKAGALSGGEQRMVAVARALMGQPALLLLDEPTAGLAPKAGAEVLAHVAGLRDSLGIGLLLVEQNVRGAIELADLVIILAAGEVVFTGSRDQAMADRELTSLYLGGKP